MANWHTLREANAARNVEWVGDGKPMDLTFRIAELLGEIGEFVEVFIGDSDANPNKHPEKWADVVARATEEVADGLICLDLTGMELGLPSIPIGTDELPSEALEQYSAMQTGMVWVLLLARLGAAANVVKKIERERRGWPGSRATPEQAWPFLWECNQILRYFAASMGINTEEAVRDKFNATSAKVGLTTRFVW